MTAAAVPSTPAAPGPAPAAPGPAPGTRRTWSIRWIVTGAMVALVAGIVLSVGAVTERNARRALETEIGAQLLLQVRNLAQVGAGALLTEIPEWTLLPLVKAIRERQPQLAFAVVTNHDGVIQADEDVRRLGKLFHPPADLVGEPGAPDGNAGESLSGNRELLVASAPIVHSDGRTLGKAWVGLRRAAIDQRLDQARQQQMLVLVVFLLVGTVAAMGLSSLLLRPVGALRAGLERIGRGDLDTVLQLSDRTELGALAETINKMTRELKSAQAEQLERARIDHEVQLAQRIQRSLLPAGRQVAGPFTIEGAQQPAAEVGGDYYQTFELPSGRIGLAVADVSGKGLAGSLVTAMLHALLRAVAATHDSPGALLASLDLQLGGMLGRGTFVTMFYGILDPARGELTFASAGHNPLLVLRGRGGRAEWVRARGAPRGVVRRPNGRTAYPEVSVAVATKEN